MISLAHELFMSEYYTLTLSNALDQLEGRSVAKIWCECRQRVVDTVKQKIFF